MTKIREQHYCPDNERHLVIEGEHEKGNELFMDVPEECPRCGAGLSHEKEVIKCDHEELMMFRESDKVECLICHEDWTKEEAKQEGLFDNLRFG